MVVSGYGGQLLIVLGAVGAALAQSGGSFEQQKRQGLDYLRNGQFDKAAARLEEVWEQQQPPDAMVAEHLAIAYLNGDERKQQRNLAERALELMEKAIAGGGQATFLVNHSHERIGLVQGSNWTKFCRGRLSIRPGQLSFVSEAGERAGEDSFDTDAAGLKEIQRNTQSDRGVFQIKAADTGGKQRTYNMVPRSWSAADSQAIVFLAEKHLLKK